MFQNLFSRFAPAPDPHAVDHQDFEEGMNLGRYAVVDVREAHEFARGHIPQSANMPLSRFDPRRLPHGKPVVLVCQSGVRSASAVRKAHAGGRNDVRHYAGGLIGWLNRNGALSR